MTKENKIVKQIKVKIVINGGFYGVVKKMTFLKKSFYLANSIIVDAMSVSVFVMDHCNKTDFYLVANQSSYKILITFDLLNYFI